jgi:hypothetical protein
MVLFHQLNGSSAYQLIAMRRELQINPERSTYFVNKSERFRKKSAGFPD